MACIVLKLVLLATLNLTGYTPPGQCCCTAHDLV